jgi:N-acetylglucosaminyldiphosphoundecaprenol N-acetyl-beta-D-mannosaminyltransferase
MNNEVQLKYLKVNDIDFDEMLELVLKSTLNHNPKIVFTPNAGHLAQIINSKEIKEIYEAADFNLIDGWPIAIAAQIKTKKQIRRVTGSDLIPKLFTILDSKIRVGIIGGNNEIELRKTIENLFPKLNLQLVNCDTWSDSAYDVKKLRELIQHNALAIVILALGHPKQEKIAYELKKFDWVGAKPDWILCVGASIDFITGTQKRAPKIFQKIGLEWLYRLLTNPKKFLFRYLKAVIPSFKLIIESIFS